MISKLSIDREVHKAWIFERPLPLRVGTDSGKSWRIKIQLKEGKHKSYPDTPITLTVFNSVNSTALRHRSSPHFLKRYRRAVETKFVLTAIFHLNLSRKVFIRALHGQSFPFQFDIEMITENNDMDICSDYRKRGLYCASE